MKAKSLVGLSAQSATAARRARDRLYDDTELSYGIRVWSNSGTPVGPAALHEARMTFSPRQERAYQEYMHHLF